jgi:hypothetical protein
VDTSDTDLVNNAADKQAFIERVRHELNVICARTA